MAKPEQFDVVVIGAGAAGMMCAIEAGKRGRRVLVLDHAAKPGEKIRISGGGRCNFTNLEADRVDRFLSANLQFARSALSRYRPADFIALIERHGVAWHEKTLGQLLCDGSAKAIIDLLLAEMRAARVELHLSHPVDTLERAGEGFELSFSTRRVVCRSVVIATGGKSIPKMGATGYGYDLARRFGVAVIEPRPALVPLTFEIGLLERLKPLAGVSVDARVSAGKARFEEAMLFTHRGLSGPAVLQASSYWREGEAIEVDMAPGADVLAALKAARQANGRQGAATALAEHVPKRLADLLVEQAGLGGPIADASDKRLAALAEAVNRWRVKPVGSEGYRTAEVTLGGIDTAALDQKTMAAKTVPGLYFVGEVVDVTGWLGGYNFQWAWASGWAAGQAA
jgi:predicted Rossmann fold flavoprotein